MERITGVAILGKGRVIGISMPPPFRHSDVIALMISEGFTPDDIARAKQGFQTDKRWFVSRKIAKRIAQRAGQIIRQSAGDSPELFSEDLW